jgi:hypothetical protein
MDVEEVAAVVVAGPKYQMNSQQVYLSATPPSFSNSILAVLYALTMRW